MRFKHVELSPANKRQYMIGLGVRDIELLLGTSLATTRNLPVLPEFKEARQRLQKVSKGLAEALEVAKRDGDEGQRVPIEERANYLKAKDNNPMLDITRMEIIDHRPCNGCNGEGFIRNANDPSRGILCGKCDGAKMRGREVIFQSKDVEVRSSIQDNGKTLKLFVDERGKPESMQQIKVIIDEQSDNPLDIHFKDSELLYEKLFGEFFRR